MDEIVFGQGGGADCIWTFNEQSVGHQYLFYLTRPETFSESDRRFLPSKEPGYGSHLDADAQLV